MSDGRWIHSAYPSSWGAVGASVAALVGGALVFGAVWIAVSLGLRWEFVVGYLTYCYLSESALATYRKWQRDP